MGKSNSYDVIVIGAGPGGYVCAIRCAQLGLRVACVEKRKTLGGTCLNVGCIPSKALLHASQKFQETKGHMQKMGIDIKGASVNIKNMMAFKNDVVDANTKGLEFLFKKNGIERIAGSARLIAVEDDGYIHIAVGSKAYNAKNIVIATGSESAEIPGVKVDEKNIVSSTGALEFGKVPKSLCVIGGGVIGLELGSIWGRLGAKVTIVEFMDTILPGMDKEVSREMKKILEGQGMEFKLSTRLVSAKVSGKGKKVDMVVEPADGGKAEEISAEKLLIAVGRVPHTRELGLEDVGVKTDKKGMIVTDSGFETSVEGVYAIGDVIKGPMLAHKAEEDGVAVAEIIAGQAGHVDYNLVPGVVYTHPEVASVGKTEEQLKSDGVDYKVGRFPFSANGRARAMGEMQGFVKILSDAKTDRVLGAHIIGAEAGTLIAEIVIAMEFGASAEDIARTCHAHPGLSEAVKEAALAVGGGAIHC